MTTLGSAARWHPEPIAEQVSLERADVRGGNDVLKLISSAMYVDHMSVYREYVQNAADAIDAARAAGFLSPDDTGTVTIDIDGPSRSITIRMGWPQCCAAASSGYSRLWRQARRATWSAVVSR